MSDIEQYAYDTVTLLGGGSVDPDDLAQLLHVAPTLVAADGGANYAHAHKIPVKHIVGDFDSVTNLENWRKSGAILTQIDEQNSTDFEKCLTTIRAETYLCAGFLGKRLDHALACLRSLAAFPEKRILLLSDEDVVMHCPCNFKLELPEGTRVSLFPMGPVEAIRSKGLKWPIDGLKFEPSGMIGTSNEALGGEVHIELASHKMLILLPKAYWKLALSALADAP